MTKRIGPVKDIVSGYAYTGLWLDNCLGWNGVGHVDPGTSQAHPDRPSQGWLLNALPGDRAYLVKITLTLVRDKKGRPITTVKKKTKPDGAKQD